MAIVADTKTDPEQSIDREYEFETGMIFATSPRQTELERILIESFGFKLILERFVFS